VKKLVFIATVLCTYTIACNPENTKKGNLWRRPVEPYLTGMDSWRAYREAPPKSVKPECDDDVDTHARAIEALASQPPCTESAIRALERLGRTDATVLSDLAAAYYIRWQKENVASDLLKAHETINPAIAARRDLPAVLFNHALIHERLGLTIEAARSWDELVRVDHSSWTAEAREHRNRLNAVSAATRWDINRDRIPAALRAGDRAGVKQLMAPFPQRAYSYFLEELLPHWAETPSPANLADVGLFASVLSELTHDRLVADAAATLVEASPERLAALREGHTALAEGRRHDRTYNRTKAVEEYERAAELLERGGSPLRLVAKLAYATSESFAPGGRRRGLALIETIEAEAKRRSYSHLLTRIEATRAFLLLDEGDYVNAQIANRNVLDTYRKARDLEGFAATLAAQSGVYLRAGHNELAWREALAGLRLLPHVADLRNRHVIFGAASDAALALGHRFAALAYQDTAVEMIRKDLASAPPDPPERILNLTHHLGVARRKRARIQLALGRHPKALEDLTEARRLMRDASDADTRRSLELEFEEVRGQFHLQSRPDVSVAAFTSALGLATLDDLRTQRASLLAQRGQAYELLGRNEEAEKDYRAALGELRAAEERLLQRRKPGEGEELWPSIFSRFQDTYGRLIRLLMRAGREEEAFQYAESARALEPLNLLSCTPSSLKDIQRQLTSGTVILQYSLLNDQTYAWVVTRDRFEAVELGVGRSKVAQWQEQLQRAVRGKNARDCGVVLREVYNALITAPLNKVGPPPKRLVFVPDGAMHGLPLPALQNPRTGRYLLQDYTVATAGSATLYVLSLSRDRSMPRAETPSILLIGDPAFDPSTDLTRDLEQLGGALEEVEAIAPLYPRADIRTGAEATVPEFLKLAPQYTVVHLAAHAIANPRDPSQSMLLLAKSSEHSGQLRPKELLTELHLDRTRLAVLSACSSAGGVPVGPEGVAPLVRPLITAGVPAVIGSLWDVDDATAATLLVSFHRHYTTGSDAATALQNAQRELLTSNDPDDWPVYQWAPFQVIGYASSPHAPRTPAKERPP